MLSEKCIEDIEKYRIEYRQEKYTQELFDRFCEIKEEELKEFNLYQIKKEWKKSYIEHHQRDYDTKNKKLTQKTENQILRSFRIHCKECGVDSREKQDYINDIIEYYE